MLSVSRGRLASSICKAVPLSCVALKHTLPDLSYDYGALEPVISAEIMELHHSKHHQTYVNNLNVAEEKLAEATGKGTNYAVVIIIKLDTDPCLPATTNYADTLEPNCHNYLSLLANL